MRSSLVVGAAAIALVLACGLSRLPSPPLVSHPSDALVAVPFPPPPPRIEIVPARPNEDAVWIDGEWVWRGRRWAWRLGRWVTPPPNTRYAPWTLTRRDDGVLFVAQGAWRGASDRVVPDPKPLAVARTTTGPVSDPEGDEVALPTVPVDEADAGAPADAQ